MYKFLIIILIAYGCGPTFNCRYVSDVSGITFCFQNDLADTSHVPELLEYYELILKQRYSPPEGFMDDILANNIFVYYTTDQLYSECTQVVTPNNYRVNAYHCKNGMQGFNVDGVYIEVKYNPVGWCVGQGSFGHEMLHSFEFIVYGASADDLMCHNYLDGLFNKAGYNKSIEKMLNEKAASLCSNLGVLDGR